MDKGIFGEGTIYFVMIDPSQNKRVELIMLGMFDILAQNPTLGQQNRSSRTLLKQLFFFHF